jgi:hypothetical protein
MSGWVSFFLGLLFTMWLMAVGVIHAGSLEDHIAKLDADSCFQQPAIHVQDMLADMDYCLYGVSGLGLHWTQAEQCAEARQELENAAKCMKVEPKKEKEHARPASIQ